MVIRTYFDKNNTIVKNSYINTARNPVTELFYGGTGAKNKYSRFLFHFDEERLRELYTGGTLTDLTKLTHKLYLTNTGSFDLLVNGTMGTKVRTSSFSLIVFKLSQDWDEGVGYDYQLTNDEFLIDNAAVSITPSNWFDAQTNTSWANGEGSYSGSPTGFTIATQHFDAGNENIEVDITSYVNGLITGDTNYGLGIAFTPAYEAIESTHVQYVGFFTNKTQTFYEPYVESVYANHIKDDRNNFFMDKPNKLYLYVNLAGNPTNLDTLPNVAIYDQDEGLIEAFDPSEVNHVTKGVYSINLSIPTSGTSGVGYLLHDIWSGIVIEGVTRPDIRLSFELRDSMEYYNIGNTDCLPKRVAVTVAGIQNQEKIVRGDIRKIIVSARVPYTVEQTQYVNSLKYRLFVKEGRNELTVVDFQDIEMATNYNYFLLDTQSLLPNTYYIDIKSESNLEVNTLKSVLSFTVASESNFRVSQ